MDILTLNKTNYSVTGLVEGFSSKIWTERFQDPGDFEFRSPNIEATMAALPELSLVSIRDSKEVMIVESHEITLTEEGHPELIVKGQSATSIFDHRVLWKYQTTPLQMRRSYTVKDAIMIYALAGVTAPGEGTAGEGDNVVSDGAMTGFGFFEQKLPNVTIGDSFLTVQPSKIRFIEPGLMGPVLKEMLAKARGGIRTIRPVVPSIKVFTANPTTGIITRTVTANVNKLVFDFYEGENKTSDVIFDFALGHLTNLKRLADSSKYKSVWIMDTNDPTGHSGIAREEDIVAAGGASDGNFTGWDYRLGYTFTSKPGGTLSDWVEDQKDRGQAHLRKDGSRSSIVDGQISLDAPFKYKTDYDLGDRVTIRGEYGINRSAQITEYIRTQDVSGESGYPTFKQWP